MNCIACKNGHLYLGHVTLSLTRGETLVVVKQVPAQVCDNCGEYTLDSDIAHRVYSQADVGGVLVALLSRAHDLQRRGCLNTMQRWVRLIHDLPSSRWLCGDGCPSST